ncbi:MAG: phosphodiester glycosidase family protein [Clostridia bacterium]|nr:phosphodiester glycosidase family protein [Clostridia bacterium]
MKKSLCILLLWMLLFSAIACGGETQETATEPPAAIEDPDIVILETPEPGDTEQTTLPPTEPPADTPEPTPEPEPTRVPKAGDIAQNFPDYDTGADADYSYQSDDLRIAIKVIENPAEKQVVYVADIWIRNINAFRTAFGNSEFGSGTEDPEKLTKRENAIFGVNGSYNQGLTLHAGEKYKGLRENKGWNSQAVCIIYKDGTMKTFQLSEDRFNLNDELKNGAWHGWQFGPILIRDYEISPYALKYRLGNKARNILGYYEPGHYVIVTCDAGTKKADGMTEVQMANFMKSLGVKDAFNLDGGTSAVMVFMGEIINNPRPHVNDKGSFEEGRKLKDMLLFGEYDENGVSVDLSTLTADKFKGK